MSVATTIMRALTDNRFGLKSSAPLKVLGLWGWHADDLGAIHPDDDGQQVTDPKYISARLGISRAAVFTAFNVLSELGYIEWDRAERGSERVVTRVTGRVRIIVSPSSAQA